jgi:hypothetical protein
MDASCFEPAGAWKAFDGRRPPDPRPDPGPTGRALHHLSRADAPHGLHASLNEEGERGGGTQAPLGHQHVPWG